MEVSMKKALFLFFGMIFLFACGYKEGIVQKAENSYLKFSGNWENASVQIDDMESFILKRTVNPEDTERRYPDDNKLYQIAPGKHSLKVYREGNLVINRIVFLENQATMEVIIP